MQPEWEKGPIMVTDSSGRVVISIHDLRPITIARVIASHPLQEELVRGALAEKAPMAYNALESEERSKQP